MLFKTTAQASKCLAKWQGILGLKDWRIELRIVPAAEMVNVDEDGTPAEAEVEPLSDLRLARLRLLRAKDCEKLGAEPATDHELCIVHELLHLHWRGTPEEQAVHALSSALVALSRSGAGQ